jgi:hypothetical protein
VTDPVLAKRLSENAWKRFLPEWARDAIGVSVEKAVHLCLDPAMTPKQRKDIK